MAILAVLLWAFYCLAAPVGEDYFNAVLWPEIAPSANPGNWSCMPINGCMATSPCIECDNADGRLRRIFMADANLSGSISFGSLVSPASLNLLYITFARAGLQGNMPLLPTGLIFAYFQENPALGGVVPALPSSLTHLAVSSTAIISLPYLHEGMLGLYANYVPAQVKLPSPPSSLHVFRFSGALFSGTLPSQLPPNLEEFSVAAMPNMFGTLPFILPTTLEVFHVYRSQFTGALPPLIPSSMSSFLTYRSAFSGFLPALWQNASNLAKCTIVNTTAAGPEPEASCFVCLYGIPDICRSTHVSDPCSVEFVEQCATAAPTRGPTPSPSSAPLLAPSAAPTSAPTTTTSTTTTTITTAANPGDGGGQTLASPSPSDAALMGIVAAIAVLSCLALVLCAAFVAQRCAHRSARRRRRNQRPASSVVDNGTQPTAARQSSHSHRSSRRQSRTMATPTNYSRMPGAPPSAIPQYMSLPAPTVASTEYTNAPVLVHAYETTRNYEEAPELE